jgi:hypothetical protein
MDASGPEGDNGEVNVANVTAELPRARVPRVGDRVGALLDGVPWERAAVLGPLLLADGSAAAEQATRVRALCDRRALYLRFECADRDAWGTFGQRNDPVYLEEAVEVFLAPGEEAPRRYWEIEVSPLGVVFAAAIANPTGRRADLAADTTWTCPGLEVKVGAMGADQDWWAALAIPFAALAEPGTTAGPGATAGPAIPAAPPPSRWRGNLYRIERPRGGRPELSCWSPTLTDPADFHRPERFGHLEMG